MQLVCSLSQPVDKKSCVLLLQADTHTDMMNTNFLFAGLILRILYVIITSFSARS